MTCSFSTSFRTLQFLFCGNLAAFSVFSSFIVLILNFFPRNPKRSCFVAPLPPQSWISLHGNLFFCRSWLNPSHSSWTNQLVFPCLFNCIRHTIGRITFDLPLSPLCGIRPPPTRVTTVHDTDSCRLFYRSSPVFPQFMFTTPLWEIKLPSSHLFYNKP